MILSNRKYHVMLSWGLVILYADFIYAFSSMERMPFAFEAKYHTDKLVHGVEYAILGLLLARSLRISFRFRSWRRIVWFALLLGTLYAVSDEIHQSTVPHRQADAMDVVADAVGSYLGARLWIEYLVRKKKRIFEDA